LIFVVRIYTRKAELLHLPIEDYSIPALAAVVATPILKLNPAKFSSETTSSKVLFWQTK